MDKENIGRVLSNIDIAAQFVDKSRREVRDQGYEFIPEADVARNWLSVVGVLSLFEISLKYLVMVETGCELEALREQYGHNSCDLYREKVSTEHKELLKSAFEEYKSYKFECGRKDGQWGLCELSLSDYLEIFCGHDRSSDTRPTQIDWRYSLIEGMGQLQNKVPFVTEFFVELICVIQSILRDKFLEQELTSPYTVAKRLEKEFDRNIPWYVAGEDGERMWSEVESWVRRYGSFINCFSEYLRFGPPEEFSEEASKFVAEWLSNVLETNPNMSRGLGSHQGATEEMRWFIDRAKTSNLRWDGVKFVADKFLPKVDKWKLLGKKWKVEWVFGGESYFTEPSLALEDIPKHPGQLFGVNVDKGFISVEGTKYDPHKLAYKRAQSRGRIKLWCGGKLVSDFPANPLWLSWGGSEEVLEEGVKDEYAVSFIFDDEAGSMYDEDGKFRIEENWDCRTCGGSGFCLTCYAKSDECDVCEGCGLCVECSGYKRDGVRDLMESDGVR